MLASLSTPRSGTPDPAWTPGGPPATGGNTTVSSMPRTIHIEANTADLLKSTPATTTTGTAKAQRLFLPLRAVIPTDYSDMYTPDLLADPAQVNSSGRPLFTDRAITDWQLNDLRSLLIMPQLRPEWNGIVPTIVEPGYRILVLPLDATDDQIVDTLVDSDIYKEHGFDRRFRIQTAQYTVQAARHRAPSSQPNGGRRGSDGALFALDNSLTQPEWRNIIENYLLNLGCEAQCRIDYKKLCGVVKRQRAAEALPVHKITLSPPSPSSNSSTLLKKALLTSSSTSPDFPSALKNHAAPAKVSLSRAEKHSLWVQVQSRLYSRLGLDWLPDDLN